VFAPKLDRVAWFKWEREKNEKIGLLQKKLVLMLQSSFSWIRF